MTIALRYKAHNPLLKVKQLHLKMKIPKNNPHFKGFPIPITINVKFFKTVKETQNHVLLILKSTRASLSLIKINNTFSFVL